MEEEKKEEDQPWIFLLDETGRTVITRSHHSEGPMPSTAFSVYCKGHG